MLKWIATFLIIWFVYSVRSVFPPIIVGAVIAYLLLPIVQQLAVKLKTSVRIATLITYLTVVCVLAVTIWFLGPGVINEVSELAQNQKEIVKNIVQQYAIITHWEGDVEITSLQILNSIHESVGRPEEIAHIGGLLSHGFLSILVCVVSSIYFTIDSGLVFKYFLRYIPPSRRETIVELTGQMNRMLSRYVFGQLWLVGIMSTVAWCFLHWGIHLKYALPVAILSGFLEIIPVLGPIIATTIATLVGVSQFGPGVIAPIIAFYAVARWIEDFVIVPKIIGHAVSLHPLAVIFAVLCGEVLAGGLGMLIAIPVAACIKLFIDFFYLGKDITDNPKESFS
jgi:predicted PurR-regulated permease PerM